VSLSYPSGRQPPAADSTDTLTESAKTTPAAPATFQRDSLVWAFGKLAERAVRHFLRDANARARHARWLAEDPAQRADTSGLEGLLLVGVELGTQGCLRLEARPARGQFLMVVQHSGFHAVVALSHPGRSARQQCDGICLADFEGDAALATRWALGLNTWLSKRWSVRGETQLPSTLN
jgi:hypothetical protein